MLLFGSIIQNYEEEKHLFHNISDKIFVPKLFFQQFETQSFEFFEIGLTITEQAKKKKNSF